MNSMRPDHRESGIVSLLVTMVMMVVITLIALGFAEIARTEQRSSLDDALSVQAYYAAESGINDARSIITKTLAAGGTVQSKDTCGDTSTYTLDASGLSSIDSKHGVSYTCVLVDPTPATLTYQISTHSSTVVPLLSTGTIFTSINLSWTVPNGNITGCFTAGTNPSTFPDLPSWPCNEPVVRIDLFDAKNAAAPIARTDWAKQTATIFLVPFNSNSVNNVAQFSSRGTATSAQCVASGLGASGSTTCTAKICGAGAGCAALGDQSYYARISSLYVDDAQLTISAPNITFANTQATIDVTGKAQDVLRRVVVAIDLTDANAHQFPGAAIETRDSICKRFETTDSTFIVDSGQSAGGGQNPYCQ